MLKLIETKKEITDALRAFNKSLSDSWKNKQSRLIVWRPNSRNMDIITDGRYWFAPPPSDDTRFAWNTFGILKPSGNLPITVEINVPRAGENKRVSGFFAKDEESGAVLLMHDGGVGGGRKGIGRNNFFAWTQANPLPVANSSGSVRHGLVVTDVADKNAGSRLSDFIQSVADFKEAVVGGHFSAPSAQKAAKSYADYFKEFSGIKKGIRPSMFEYHSRHGDVVHALFEWRKKQGLSKKQLVKDPYIDLGVEDLKGRLVELYEVKTNADRQSLYTAIGQLIVHSSTSQGASLKLVLPTGEKIGSDLQAAIALNNIEIIYFRLTPKRATIIS